MKQEFIDFINKLMESNPELTNQLMTDNIRAYLDTLTERGGADKPMLTPNGMIILKHLREHQDIITWKARDIAQDIGIASRGVAGALRKLCTDGFVEKLGKDPAIYTLTEKGKNYLIEEEI